MNFDLWRHYLRARLFILLKNQDRAIDEYRLALAGDADFHPAASALSMLHGQRKQWAEAERYAREALRVRPKSAALRYNLGYLIDQQGRRREAIEQFHQVVAKHPKLDRAWYGLGMAYAALGEHEEAVKALERAALLQPENGHVWYVLGMAHHHAHQPDRVKEIIEYLDRFDRHNARRLIHEAERADLAHLVKDLVV